MMYIRIQSPIIYNGYSYEDFPPTKSTKSILGSISNGAVLKKKKKRRRHNEPLSSTVPNLIQ